MSDAPPPLPPFPPVADTAGVAAAQSAGVVSLHGAPLSPPSPSSSSSAVHVHHLSSHSVSHMPRLVPPSPASSASFSAAASPSHHHSNSSLGSILDAGEGAHAGWLLKLGGQVKLFKKRFFRVAGSRLEYYKDDTASSRRLGVIPLLGARLVLFDKSIYGESACFGVTPVASKRTFVLKASDEANMHTWLGWLRPQVSRQVRDRSFLKTNKQHAGAVKEGIVEQQKGEREKWSERFLVLGSHLGHLALVLYKEVESTKPAVELLLDNQCTVESEELPEAPFCFAVSCSRASNPQRKFVFRVGDASERDDWVAAIKVTIEGASSPTDAGAADSAPSSATHSSQPSLGDLPATPASPSHGGAHAEIRTIAKSDGAYQYSESESDEHSDLSIDSVSEHEDEEVQSVSEQISNVTIGRPLPPVPERPQQQTGAAPPLPAGPRPAREQPASSSPASSSPAAASPASSSSSSSAAVVSPASPSGPAVIVASSASNPAGVQIGAENPSSQVVKEGYLRKLGAKVKNWKNRFFKLTGYVLSYHESREQQTPVLGEIQLTGTLAKQEPDSLFGMPFTFSVHQTQAGQRTYYFVAESQADMEDWITLLRERHSFSPQGLPLRLNPRVRIDMAMNPDDAALRAIAVNSKPINSSYISTDADRKENSKSTLKGAVSKKKRRFVMDGYDLDLTYITNRIVAMGFPSDGTEAIYRNAMVDVQRFLKERHDNHYKVYNLCSERKYPPSSFSSCAHFPFDDHNNCYFEDMPYFCKDVADFLSEHEKNVALIHCKAGKGRTGLLIVVFLLFCGEWQTASEALRYYAFARTQNQKGVTIASQIRWVHYFEKYLQLSRDGVGLPKLQALALRKMTFSKKYPAFDFFVANCHGHTDSSKDKEASVRMKETKTKEGGLEIEFLPPAGGWASDPQHWVFAKDLQFEFFKGKLFGGSARVMSFWLHTQFLAMEPDYRIKLERCDIDKVSKDKTCPDFSLELQFEPVYEGRMAEEVKAPHNVLSSSLVITPHPHMPSLPASLPGDDRDMLEAALSMMLEGRKMTRFYLGNKELKEKEVEKKDVHVFIKKDDDANTYSLYYCLDSESLSNAGGALGGYERIPFASFHSLHVGKESDVWSRSVAARQTAEERCFTLKFEGGELHLEAYSARQLALWIEGFRFLLRAHADVQEEEGEAFQQSLLSLTAGRSAASQPSGAGASEGARERAETFAKPPAIKVPENKSRRVLRVKQK